MVPESTKPAHQENEVVYLRGLIHAHNTTKIELVHIQQQAGPRIGFALLANLTIPLPIIIRTRMLSLEDMIVTMRSPDLNLTMHVCLHLPLPLLLPLTLLLRPDRTTERAEMLLVAAADLLAIPNILLLPHHLSVLDFLLTFILVTVNVMNVHKHQVASNLLLQQENEAEMTWRWTLTLTIWTTTPIITITTLEDEEQPIQGLGLDVTLLLLDFRTKGIGGQ